MMSPSPCSLGRLYLSGLDLPDIRIVDSESLREIERISVDSDVNYCIAISDYLENAEMNLIAFTEESFANPGSFGVSVHSTTTKELITRISRGRIGGVPGVHGLEIFSPDRFRTTAIVLTGGENRLCAYDAFSGKKIIDCTDDLPSLTDGFCRIKCFPDWNPTEVFLGGSDDRLGGLCRCDLSRDCIRIGSYVGHVGEPGGYSCVNSISASLSSGILFSGSNDDGERGTMKLWDKDTFQCIETVPLSHSCYSMLYSSDTHLICCGTRDVVEIFDIRNLCHQLREIQTPGYIFSLDHISSSPFFVSVSNKGGAFISVWSPRSGKVMNRRRMDGCVTCIQSFLPHQPKRERLFDQEVDEEERIQFLMKRAVEESGEQIAVGVGVIRFCEHEEASKCWLLLSFFHFGV